MHCLHHIMSNSWSDLPGDILCLTAKHLSFKELVRVSVICKTWRLVILEAIRHHSIMCLPWLTSHDPWRSTIRIGPIFNNMYEPQSTKQTCSLAETVASDEVKLLESACVCASKYGWLLLLETKPTSAVMYFYNPFRNAIVELPSLPLDIGCPGFETECVARVIFTAPPTSPDCLIFLVSERRRVQVGERNAVSKIKTCSLKDGRWITIHTTSRSVLDICDMVYIGGVLHCLYYNDSFFQMVTCNVTLQDWTLINYRYSKSSLNLTTCGQFRPLENMFIEHASKFYCLVESTHGELLLVSCRNYWQVHRFDLSTHEWTPIHSLGDQVLLINEQEFRDDRRKQWSAMAVPAVGEARKFANMIVVLEGRQCRICICNIKGHWKYDATFALDKEKGYYSWTEPPM